MPCYHIPVTMYIYFSFFLFLFLFFVFQVVVFICKSVTNQINQTKLNLLENRRKIFRNQKLSFDRIIRIVNHHTLIPTHIYIHTNRHSHSSGRVQCSCVFNESMTCLPLLKYVKHAYAAITKKIIIITIN